MTPALLIEAFSSRACAGNGAAVLLLDHPWSDGALQGLAGSLRQSETAFLLPWSGHWLLRWFTPSVEVPLCGHATLAAVLALGHWQRLTAGQQIRFLTRSGPLAGRLSAGTGRSASIDLPAGRLQPEAPSAELQALLRRRGLGEPQRFWTSALGYAVVLLDAQAPLAAQRDLAAELPAAVRNGLVLMQPAARAGSDPDASVPAAELDGQPVDYRLRFFAPGLGIDEDPVTGSAHALVAPWWQERLGRPRVVGWQCSDRPGGVVCEGLPSGMIRLYGSGHLLWDGTVHTGRFLNGSFHTAALHTGMPSASMVPLGSSHGSEPGQSDWPAGSQAWRALLAVA